MGRKYGRGGTSSYMQNRSIVMRLLSLRRIVDVQLARVQESTL
jgi:hypothetical protein